MILWHAALALATALFLISPHFTDLLPFIFPRILDDLIPPSLRPLLLLAAFFLWLRALTPGKWPTILARFFSALPVVLVAAIPIFPHQLMNRQWMLAAAGLFFLAPPALIIFSPLRTSLRRRRKILFVVLGWIASAAYAFWTFLIVVHGDALPLFLATTLWILLTMAAAWAGGMKIAPAVVASGVLLFFLFGGLAFYATPRTPRRPPSHFAAGPYLQNLQKDRITILWETNPPLPGEIWISRAKEALESGVSADRRILPAETARLHEISIDALAADTEYYYRVWAGDETSPVGRFRTAPAGDVPFSFVVYGDSQKVFDWAEYLTRNKHREVCASILRDSPEARFAVHVGDMTFLGDEPARWYDEFFGPARDLMRNTVVWPTIGNHELDAALYFDYFSVPHEDEHYYSFDFGAAHFTVLAVEGYAVGHEYGPKERTPMEPDSAQYAWLEKDLAENQDKTWRFVFFHQAALSSGIEGEYTPARKIFIPLFEKYGVTAVFSGHDHDFECSVKDDIAYFVTGGGGGPVNSVALDARKNPYSRYFRGTWHHCNVHIEGQRLDLKAIDRRGNVFYRFTADKSSGKTILSAG